MHHRRSLLYFLSRSFPMAKSSLSASILRAFDGRIPGRMFGHPSGSVMIFSASKANAPP
ncbi:MAG: hypothetical protein PHZ09_10705 [Eubacteriales bacterium]|nr:hypothetical protein [Eubacteriales bacterium]